MIGIRVLTTVCLLASAAAGVPLSARTQTSESVRAGYKVGDRVEINVDGTWYAASVSNALDNRYRVQRDDRQFGVSSTEEWVKADRLRPLAAKPSAPHPPAGRLSASVPIGLYDCTTFGSGNTAGKLRILTASASSGVTPDGAGPQHAFTYEPATGAITWPGGLTIFSWTVERAEFRPSAKGIPNINLHYRSHAGGNLNSMGCQRE